MKKIRPNKLIVTPLHSVVIALNQNGQAFSSLLSSLLFTCIAERINVTNINADAIINDFSTTIQLPK
jgi:hypothetical protein